MEMKLAQTRTFHSISKMVTNSTWIHFSKASHNTGVLQFFVVRVPKTKMPVNRNFMCQPKDIIYSDKVYSEKI